MAKKRTRGSPASTHPPSSAEASLSGRRALAASALLVAATVAVYYPCLHGGFIFDDHLVLLRNPLVKASDGLFRNWFTTDSVDYWPVFNSGLWVQWRLWGTDPLGYHLTNLALHVVDALLIWVVLRRLSIPGAFLAALLFALHPVNVESVAWITQLKNLLALTFALLSVLAYLNWQAQVPRQGAARAPTLDHWYLASIGAFVLAMLSKSSVAALPLLLLGITAWSRPLSRRDVACVAPFVLVSAVFAAATTWFRARYDVDVRTLSLTERLLEVAGAVGFYLYKALLPVRLSFFYPKWQVDADQIRWWLPLLAGVALTGALWRFRSGWGRPVLWAWLFFCVALAPALGISGAGFLGKWSVADHYQHIALIPVVVLASAAWATWRQRASARGRWMADGAAAAVAGAFALLTWHQSGVYVDDVTLYRASLRHSPISSFAHDSLGAALLSAGQPQQAKEHFDAALRLDPEYLEARNNRGLALLAMDQPEAARAEFEAVLRSKPDYLDARCNLATALVRTQRVPEALEQLRQTLRLHPDYSQAENNLGGILFETGQMHEARAHYERALRLQPEFPDAHYNLGRVMYAEGRRREAIDHFRAVLGVDPDHVQAHNALAVALMETGAREESIHHLREALRLDPTSAAARQNLEEALGDRAVGAERRE